MVCSQTGHTFSNHSKETIILGIGLKITLLLSGAKQIKPPVNELIYMYQEAKYIKRQKCVKKKVNGLTREAVTAILEAPDLNTKTGKRDIVFMTILYATAGRLDEILSIKISHLHLDTQKPYINLFGKGEKMRTSYLLPRAVAHIKVYLKEFHGSNPDPDSYLFYSRVGGIYAKLTEPALDKRKKFMPRLHMKNVSMFL
jgi:site-specific recombinase XerD